MTSRREFVKTLAAGAVLARQRGGTATSASSLGRIDVHHHMIPRFQPGNNLRDWSPQMSLDTMQKFNIATAILSEVQIPEPLNDGSEKARTLRRRGWLNL